MNIALWILQVLLALHTVMGAVWKFSNSEQTVPSLSALPHGLWLSLAVVEFLCAAALVLPALSASLALAAPVGAAVIALEMLVFCALHIASGEKNHGEMIYWLVVAALCAVIVFGRLAPAF